LLLKKLCCYSQIKTKRFGLWLVHKMKLLSFIAVLFYLHMLVPAAGLSASGSWVDLRDSNKTGQPALRVTAYSSHESTDTTENSSDPDKTIAHWCSFEFPSGEAVQSRTHTFTFSSRTVLPYASRAPPIRLA